MFLAEVALGKENSITRDDSSLRKAPNGYDCVVARGHTEPGTHTPFNWHSLLIIINIDAKDDTVLKIDSNDVTVPQGAPITMPQYNGSSFSQV